MTSIYASDIALSLTLDAARCVCDIHTGRLCPPCECLSALADAVLAYEERWLLAQNREARGVVD